MEGRVLGTALEASGHRVDPDSLCALTGLSGFFRELYLNLVDRPEHENAAYLPAVK